MSAKKYWILVLVLLFELPLPSGKCLATEQGRFHSETNGYSFAVPKGWMQIPDNIIRQASERMLSARSQLDISYETAFQLDSEEKWFQYPYVLVQVMKYSKFGINRQVRESEFKSMVKAMSGLDVTDVEKEYFSPDAQKMYSELSVGMVYLDTENRLYMFGIEGNVASVGRIKGKAVGHFGRYTIVQVMFYDRISNWTQSNSDRDLILGSFHFDPAAEYDEAAANSVGFFERRAMEALPILMLVLIIAGISAGWAYIAKKAKQLKNEKPRDDQNDD